MTLIYEPTGRAREYAPLALNIYKGCSHGCTYCFAPGATHRTRAEFNQPAPRSDAFLHDLANEAIKRRRAGKGGRALLCFTCDPYQEIDDEWQLTRHTIKILHNTGHAVTVLTKGGKRALRDLDLFMPAADAFATTLTFLDADQSRRWEPGAALPFERMETIKRFDQAGIFTWVSLEPVIEPETSLDLIRLTHPFVSAYKIGTLNHHPLAKTIDWREFAFDAVELLDSLGYGRQMDPDKLGISEYYIKKDLARWLE
jgi:DNA repair photolyase